MQRIFLATLLAFLLGGPVFAQSVTLTDVESPVIAGEALSVTFTVEAGDQTIDKVVAVVTDPKGRTLTDRNLLTADVAPGQMVDKTTSDRIPPRSLSGTYQLRAEARAADGTVLATSETRSFEVLEPGLIRPFPGFTIQATNVPETVSAGNPVTFDLLIMNGTDQTVDKIFAVVTDPKGRVLRARTLTAADIRPGKSVDRTVSERIPPGSIRGTYQVQIQARTSSGTILGTEPISFVVTD